MIAALTVAKAIFQRLWWSTPFIAAVAAISFVMLQRTRNELADMRTWQGQVLTEAQDAANNPKLIARDVPAQIRELGRGVTALRDGLNRAQASALAAARNDADRRAALKQALDTLTGQERARQSVIDRLAASAARPAPAGACDVSPTLKELWK